LRAGGHYYDLEMSQSPSDHVFSESISEIYDGGLVPMIFDHYAAEVALLLSDVRIGDLLEVAAGSGAVTRVLAASMPEHVSITATDLNQAMIDRAIKVGTARSVQWQQADVMDLSFSDASFDVVVCQFGAMFFEPKSDAFAEVFRVLRPGGQFLFSVWNGIDVNDFAREVIRSLAEYFPGNPPTFFERVPHGYHNRQIIGNDLAEGGFTSIPVLEEKSFTSRAPTALHLATAFCMGTPLRSEIEQRYEGDLGDVVNFVSASVERRFGSSNLEGKMSATFVNLKK
jgi:ubiquinone/menaquinone biosynthesis C-methylase UbiE